MHLPVLYMDLQPDDIRTSTPLNDQYLVVGAFTKLPREKSETMYELQLVRDNIAKVRPYPFDNKAAASCMCFFRRKRPFHGTHRDTIHQPWIVSPRLIGTYTWSCELSSVWPIRLLLTWFCGNVFVSVLWRSEDPCCSMSFKSYPVELRCYSLPVLRTRLYPVSQRYVVFVKCDFSICALNLSRAGVYHWRHSVGWFVCRYGPVGTDWCEKML